MSVSLTASEASQRVSAGSAKTGSLHHLLLFGGATLGIAVGLERAFSFLSTMLAARVGGPRTFGAYSVVLATAGTIAAYAGAGIGTTANRFAGQYPRDSEGYRNFLRALIIIGILSATLAAALMLAGARPLARWILHNEGLTNVLRLAALSSAAIVLLECCRGLLIGQRKFYSLLVLSITSGLGLTVVLPLAARTSPSAMVAGQGCVALLAVLACIALSRRLGLTPLRSYTRGAGPGLRPVFMFGLVQFSAFASISVASWYIASLVARSDVSLTQMGLYGVANQFRGLAALGPGLFTLVGYSLLTDESGWTYGGPARVMLANTFLTTAVAALIAGLAIGFAPWILSVAYGSSYAAGEVPVETLLATAMIHMGGMPAMQRLSIINLRATGFINLAWAVLIVLIGILLVPRGGAIGAAAAFLFAHAITHLMVILQLFRKKELAPGYLAMSAATLLVAFALAGLGYLRSITPNHHTALTVAILILWVLFLLVVAYIGVQVGAAPKILMRFNRARPSV